MQVTRAQPQAPWVSETASMQPIGIHHVALNVPDVDAALTFYTQALGGVARTDRPDFGVPGAWIDMGEQQIHLIEAPAPPDLGQHLALKIADLSQLVRELRARGLEVSDPLEIAGDSQTFVTDPGGNVIELHQVDGEL